MYPFGCGSSSQRIQKRYSYNSYTAASPINNVFIICDPKDLSDFDDHYSNSVVAGILKTGSKALMKILKNNDCNSKETANNSDDLEVVHKERWSANYVGTNLALSFAKSIKIAKSIASKMKPRERNAKAIKRGKVDA